MDREHSLKTRILFLEALPTISGGQMVLLSLAAQLLEDYDLSVLLPGEGPFAEALRALGVRYTVAPVGRYSLVRKTLRDVLRYAARLPWLILSTWRLIRREGIEVVYANSARTFVWGTLAAALAGCPIIWHHHNLLMDLKSLTLLQLLGRLRTVHSIISASEAAGVQFPFLKGKVRVIPTGVDTDLFRLDPMSRARMRHDLCLSEEEFVVGMVGDLIPIKGQHTLLEAARMDSIGAYYLVVGGTRSGDVESRAYAARLRQMAGENVIFTGRREDLPVILNALDLLVIASTTETGPLVLLEALACGVAVISTPVGRAPELLPPESLFPVGDAVALAEKVRSWRASPARRQAAGTGGRALAEERLQMEQF